jgi:phosphatidylserine decarboxylase
MNIHKEGNLICWVTAGIIMLSLAVSVIYPSTWLILMTVVVLILGALIFHFFRNPQRLIDVASDNTVYAPADGKVVVIEEVFEPEFFKDKRRLVSIFMSPLNVHVNRAPIQGSYEYVQHHPGKFLAAWDPKSSTDNERSTIVIKGKKITLLLRQVAGAVARRIIIYAKAGDSVQQGEDLGFIRFGSRVDLYLPLDAEIRVALNQNVEGNITTIAKV